MSTVLIAGASGVVGSRLLEQLLERADVTRVVAVGRRPLERSHPNLTCVVSDLSSREAVARVLPEGATAAFCGLGTTRRQAGSAAAFRAVDLDAVVHFAAAARAAGVTRLGLVSSIGADARSRALYLRTKGEAERALGDMGFDALVIARPSLIDDEGLRRDRRPAERISLGLCRPLFGRFAPQHRWAPVRASVIARALMRVVLDEAVAAEIVIESDRLHALGA